MVNSPWSSPRVASLLVALQDLFLGPADPLHEREKAHAELFGTLGEADLGPLEEVEDAGPSREEGGELAGREVLGAPEEELLHEDVERCLQAAGA